MGATSLPKRVAVVLALCVAIGPVGGCGTSKQDHSSRAASSGGAHPRLSGVIVFRRFFDAGHHTGAIFTMSPDGHGERQITHPPRNYVDSLNGPPSATPDGSTLIFDRTDPNGNGSLWRVRAAGGGERRLHAPSGMPGDGWPSVSPDGRQIAVARAWGKLDGYQDLKTGLYVMHTDGSSPRLIAAFGYRADVGGATWSPDGRRLIFSVQNNGPGRPADGSALFAVLRDGRDLHRITGWDTTGQISSPAYSPNGKLVLFWRKPSGEDFGGNYYTIRPDGRERRKLTSFPAGSNLATGRFSPDGRWIVFANTGVGGSDDVFLMRADATDVSPLTRTPAWESGVTWIP
jgi:TolB protein